jgi:prepilin-type N-terminal cleavage/methylation domain-containing protein
MDLARGLLEFRYRQFKLMTRRRTTMKRQSGFTLVEIAIVLVIIGLLLGGILKGQELINSARVRNLADTATGIQAAYYGFVDRYRRVPGDWNVAGASQAIGTTIPVGGNDNGQIDNGTAGAVDYEEPNAMWVQMAAAGFITGTYTAGNGTVAADAAPTNANGVTPLNAFNNVMILGRTDDFLNAPSARLHLVMGRGIPVDVMRELDLKLDDGQPSTGDLRAAPTAATWFTDGNIGGQDATCVDTTATPDIWNVRLDAQSCNAVYMF